MRTNSRSQQFLKSNVDGVNKDRWVNAVYLRTNEWSLFNALYVRTLELVLVGVEVGERRSFW